MEMRFAVEASMLAFQGRRVIAISVFTSPGSKMKWNDQLDCQ